MMKKCCKCKVEKSFSEFPSNKSKKDGLQTECRECRSLVKKNPLIENHKKSLTYKGGVCEDCDKVFEYPRDMEDYHYHHTNPSTKSNNVSRIIAKRYSWKSIQEELDKCVLLCRPCHHKRHKDYNDGLRPTL